MVIIGCPEGKFNIAATYVTWSIINAIFSLCRQAMSKYRKDQKVCCQGLKLLMELTRHLSNQESPDSDLQASREIAAHILKAFW